jgi:cell division protein FtsQ
LKARTKRKRRRFNLFNFILLLTAAGGLVYGLLALPIWKIQEVAVSGAKMLSADEIRDLSGIPLSENLFLSSFTHARNNFNRIAAIESFHIFRIPPGTVLIRIKERKPVAVVVLKNRSALVDEKGYILNCNPNLTLNVPNITEMPVISGLGTYEVMQGERIDAKTSRLISAIVLELSSRLGSRRIQLELGGFEKISFLLDDILRVKIGRDEEVQRKMEVFKSLLPRITGRWAQVEYVDVRYPDNPVIKFR